MCLVFVSPLPLSVTSQCLVTGGRKGWTDEALCNLSVAEKGHVNPTFLVWLTFLFFKGKYGKLRATGYYGMYSGFLKMWKVSVLAEPGALIGDTCVLGWPVTEIGDWVYLQKLSWFHLNIIFIQVPSSGECVLTSSQFNNLKKIIKKELRWLIQWHSGFRPLSRSQSVKAPEGPVALQGVWGTPRSRCGCDDLLCRIKHRAHKPVLHFQFRQWVQRNIIRADFSRHALKKILFTYL